MAARPNPIPAPVVDHEAQTVTFAVTFEWRKEGIHLDHCEAGVLAGDLYRLIVAHYRGDEWTQLGALLHVQTWEPNEERHIGSHSRRARLFDADDPVVKLPTEVGHVVRCECGVKIAFSEVRSRWYHDELGEYDHLAKPRFE